MPAPLDSAERVAAGRAARRPEQLLLAFLGEFVLDADVGHVPSAVLIGLLAELGVGDAATRATLARMSRRDLLAKVRSGREVAYGLAPAGESVLREARGRVLADEPFAPVGTGWTLVTFSVPESQRDLRHRVRATLTWSGFGLLRDGLWIAPGEVDVASALRPLDGGLADVELSAFRAYEIEGFSATRAVRSAWRLDEIRAHHLGFLEVWDGVEASDDPLRDMTALGADWLALLRADPRLPAEHLTDAWPSGRSAATFRRLREVFVGAARADLLRRLGRSGAPVTA
ncbi:PaaX family transcriptional regulator [Myceligenerans xiligouense]|uniref:PaaX family transcriptional regulator n=1 Tax=Myceligenerans xiligouense TaxID=253184 RepID=A0A3N4Z7Q1_9MICO|nr:PaaX family transcriptional regulator C-terminal domain-containing protein [Myceligenerans xiligouense]RPF21878.1 PaaX family transcriptional regulator [Myceligenerans xiligouense]